MMMMIAVDEHVLCSRDLYGQASTLYRSVAHSLRLCLFDIDREIERIDGLRCGSSEEDSDHDISSINGKRIIERRED